MIQKQSSKKVGRTLVSLVLAFYVLSAFIAASPPSALGKLFAKVFGRTLNRFGLYSSFALFAPYPADFNQEFQAEIKFADGTRQTWIFPHLALVKDKSVDINREFFWSEWQIYFMSIPSPAKERLWSDAAKYVARMHRNPANQPVSVTIYRKYNMILAPHSNSDSGEIGPEKFDKLVEYPVELEVLK